MTPKERAQLQIKIGETAHAGRSGTHRDDWVDAAHYVLLNDLPDDIRQLYKNRGVVWADLRRAYSQHKVQS